MLAGTHGSWLSPSSCTEQHIIVLCSEWSVLRACRLRTALAAGLHTSQALGLDTSAAREPLSSEMGRSSLTWKPLVLHPTEKEFNSMSFEAYIAFHEPKIIKAGGICKIVMPESIQPRSSGYGSNLNNLAITRAIRQNAAGSRGLYRMIYVVQKPMTLQEFKQSAEQNQPSQEVRGGVLDDAELERKFWKNIGLNPPLYGADIEGSLFDEKAKGWNPRHLNTVLSSVLEESGFKLPGVNTPYLYFGQWRSVFAWHTEDMDLYSVNYLHFGAGKQWYVVPPEHRTKFETVVKDQFPDMFKSCPEFLRHKELMISPQFLDTYQIPYVKVVQRPREFVITYPGAYHAGFNQGFNCAESTNFATKRWIPIGARAGVCRCQSDAVTIDMRLFRHLVPARQLPDELFEDSSDDDDEDDDDEEENSDDSSDSSEEEATRRGRGSTTTTNAHKRKRAGSAAAQAASGSPAKRAMRSSAAGGGGSRPSRAGGGAGQTGAGQAAEDVEESCAAQKAAAAAEQARQRLLRFMSRHKESGVAASVKARHYPVQATKAMGVPVRQLSTRGSSRQQQTSGSGRAGEQVEEAAQPRAARLTAGVQADRSRPRVAGVKVAVQAEGSRPLAGSRAGGQVPAARPSRQVEAQSPPIRVSPRLQQVSPKAAVHGQQTRAATRSAAETPAQRAAQQQAGSPPARAKPSAEAAQPLASPRAHSHHAAAINSKALSPSQMRKKQQHQEQEELSEQGASHDSGVTHAHMAFECH